MALYGIEYVKENQSAFAQKVIDISNKLAVNPDTLMAVMLSEANFDSHIVNSIGCVGLIQMCPDQPGGTYKTLDGEQVDLKYLASLDNVSQLEYVYKYFSPYAGRLNTIEDLYLVNFFPAALGWSDDKVLQTNKLPASLIAAQNKSIDLNGDGQITVGEFKQWARSKLPTDYVSDPTKDPTTIDKGLAYVKAPANRVNVIVVIVGLIILFWLLLKIFKKK